MEFYYKLDPLQPKEIQLEIKEISEDAVCQFIIKNHSLEPNAPWLIFGSHNIVWVDM